jgi:glycine/D-amino acid oxidase-like deaminating enzyme
MPRLLVVGGGLFGSLAAAYARSKGIEARVFDPGLPGAASHAAAGLFKEEWAGKKLQYHYQPAVDVLDALYAIRTVTLTHDDGRDERFSFVPPRVILETEPVRQEVTAIGDGWLEARGQRHQGWVYVAAGIWCGRFFPTLGVYGKTGVSFVFDKECPGRIRPIGPGQQAIAFVRDPGTSYFGDGTALPSYTDDDELRTLRRAADMGLNGTPISRLWGIRPYVPGGPVFRKLGDRTWLAAGGRKMGTLLAASFARRLIDDELVSRRHP